MPQTHDSPLGAAPRAERVELGYCPRCGVLGTRAAGAGPHCPACRRHLDWVWGRRRPRAGEEKAYAPARV